MVQTRTAAKKAKRSKVDLAPSAAPQLPPSTGAADPPTDVPPVPPTAVQAPEPSSALPTDDPAPADHGVTSSATPAAADSPAPPQVPWDDRQDRMLNPVLFLEIQAKVAKAFDIDAFARDDGSNALCSAYCSPAKSFFDCDLANKMLWINAPFDAIDAAMSYYFAHKGPATGAVFLVPRANKANPPSWVQFTKQMQLLHEFPRGSRLFTGPNPGDGNERHLLPPTRQDIQLWYDAPGSLPNSDQIDVQLDVQANAVILKLRHKMQVPVTVAGIPTVALVDTGAEGLPG